MAHRGARAGGDAAGRGARRREQVPRAERRQALRVQQVSTSSPGRSTVYCAIPNLGHSEFGGCSQKIYVESIKIMILRIRDHLRNNGNSIRGLAVQ